MTTVNRRRRFAAGTSAFALALMGSLALGTAASAAPAPGQEGAPSEGALHIHKLVGAEGAAGTGEEQSGVPGTPLEGAEFTIWQLGKEDAGTCAAIDLIDSEAWNNVPTGTAPATLDEVKDDYCVVGTEQVGTTNGSGELSFTGLNLGLYYVMETDAPDNIVGKTAPFYVSIPLPNGNNFLYDVHVYPKNQEEEAPSKELNDDADQTGLAIGDTVEYTITQKVPVLGAGQTYTTASIWDNLGTDLEYDSTVSFTYDGVALDAADYDIIEAAPLVTWKLTPAGLTKLEAGKDLVVVFKAKVVNVTENGDIDNPGSDDPTKPGYGGEFNGETTPGGTNPHTYWGELKINKVDPQATPLKGAEFEVYPMTGTQCTDVAPAGDPVATGTSNDQGIVIWDVTGTADLGLFIANSDDGPIVPAPSKAYCVYETVVPAGYVGAGVAEVEIEAGSNNVFEVDMVNNPKDGPDLPLTGAQGTILMTLTGIALAGIGGGIALVSRRRENANAQV